MINKKIMFLIIGVIVILLYGMTYLPRNIINIDKTEVSKITIIKGDSGERIDIISNIEIEYIINNLNNIKFQKQLIFGNKKGFTYGLEIYNQDNKIVKEIVIFGNGQVRYGSSTYKTVKTTIDCDYIENLF